MNQEATSRTRTTMLRHGKLVIVAATSCLLTLGATAASASTGSHQPPRHSPAATAGHAYVFWMGTNGDLFEAQGPANGNLTSPANLRMGPLGSAPAVGADSAGNTYVYWRGTNNHLYEAFWTGSRWAGPYDRGMGPLGSEPTVAITGNGTAYVFWKGTNGQLYEAQGPATGSLTGPIERGMGPLGTTPAAGADSGGNAYVYWRGAALTKDLYEGFSNGSTWAGPYNRDEGKLGSRPGIAIHG